MNGTELRLRLFEAMVARPNASPAAVLANALDFAQTIERAANGKITIAAAQTAAPPPSAVDNPTPAKQHQAEPDRPYVLLKDRILAAIERLTKEGRAATLKALVEMTGSTPSSVNQNVYVLRKAGHKIDLADQRQRAKPKQPKPATEQPQPRPDKPADTGADELAHAPLWFHNELRDALPKMRRAALGLTRNPDTAADLCHDAVVRMLAAHRAFIQGTNFLAWARRIIRNQFLDGIRRNKKLAGAVNIDDMQIAVDAGMDERIQVLEVSRALANLPKDQRKTLLAHAFDGAGQRAIAEIHGVAAGTVKSRVHRAREALKEAMQ